MKKIYFFIFSFHFFFSSSAQDKNQLYIQKYKDLAISEMQVYGIPASITLAQGLLESGSGESYLAVKGLNHFGIKCHNDWKGLTINADDDEKNECFRKYKSVFDSYRDHSLFLVKGKRYSFLFETSSYSFFFKKKEFKRWAKGLQKAGYATNPKYASLLIDLIQKYELYEYDRIKKIHFYSIYSFGFPFALSYGIFIDRSNANIFSNRSFSFEIKSSFVISSIMIGQDFYKNDKFFSFVSSGLVYFPIKEKDEFLPSVSVGIGLRNNLDNRRNAKFLVTRIGLDFIKKTDNVYSRNVWKDMFNDYYILPLVSFSYYVN